MPLRNQLCYPSQKNQTHQNTQKIAMNIREISDRGLKLVTPKQMLQILPIALVQVKTCNTSESLLTEIRQIIHSLYQAK